MTSRIIALLVTTIGLTSLTLPARAVYSGLLLIPTAETVGDGQYAVYLQIDGSIPDRKADTYLLDTQFGFGDRWEAGVDVDLSEGADPRFLYNAKYLVAEEGSTHPAVAVGVSNTAKKIKSSPYLVLTKTVSDARVHLGTLGIEGAMQAFVGVDLPLNERWQLMADYTTGRDNYASLGACYSLSERTGILAGVLFPNGDGPAAFSLYFCFSGAYRSGDQGQ